MLKRIFGAAIGLLALTVSALAAGSISLSLSQQFDSQGRPLSGGKLYFFVSGTTTPQSAYQDVNLSIAHANPIELDASGRVPAFYLADGYIKIRLTDSTGVAIIAVDGLLVIGPSSGGGGGSSVDATTVLATGDVKSKYGTGTLTGFVRLNGRTIGSASSGGTERANSDAQSLFEYLWTADSSLSVSGGRGATANADWLANKTIALPDFRGRVPAALDDMGNSAASRLTSTYLGTGATTLGAVGGAQSSTLATSNLPAYTPAGSVAVALSDPGHGHVYRAANGGGDDPNGGIQMDLQSQIQVGPSSLGVGSTDATLGNQIAKATTGISVSSQTFTGTAQGGTSTAFANLPPMILLTFYIKL